MKWFKHQSDARNSLKLRKVRRKYGADGYAIYWFCLEAIAYEVDKDNLTFELKEDAETIAFELSIQEKRVEEIMYYMVEIGLFESSSNMITCMKLAESIDKSMTNSPSMRKWLETQSVMTSSESVMTLPDTVKTCAELEVEKEKKRKEKTIKSSDHLDYNKVQEIFNNTLTKASKVVKLTDKRKKLVKKLFTDFDLDYGKFEAYLGFINNHPDTQWMFEARPKNDGSGQNWKPQTFEYFVGERCFLNAKENL
ncbi:protein of unknown function DUF4373 [Vibrio phage 1.132.O._10N.222.49.F8]|nr:protein of unknown function DUF4373 [Vibrio phage 1.132.O._10N.222.49.F8]